MEVKIMHEHSRQWGSGTVDVQQDIERQVEKGEKGNAAYSKAFDNPIWGLDIKSGKVLADRLKEHNRYLGKRT